MRITWDTPVSSLMHNEFDHDELIHFKYIRKEKGPSGNWIYYYPNGATSNADGSGASYDLYDKKTGRGKIYKQTKSDGDGYGEYQSGNDKLIVKKSNRLFSGTSKCEYYINGTSCGSRTVKSIGILERGVKSAMNWLGSLSIFKKKKKG